MSEPDNLTLAMMRRIDQKLDTLIENVVDLRERVASLEGQAAGLRTDLARLDLRVDRIEIRPGRIERRPELTPIDRILNAPVADGARIRP